ncbi:MULTISPECIES: DUF2993 domain-containing protein [unclassified Rathayibacter]|uniref:LmeA family phospholipid-binding protein n=1 Tax=unclassified Rathayibacter TaxID=2609250 RepID=UPI00188D2793|nr:MULTISPECIES: DUF2993 domain-containing protein [unclassified Rathayibacter]MBF4463505.1 DUF2993 domain-containing protein [Rathayibacter sp. VKM Ac-2879]MBF4504773.1 DUF2993 domain-containing protein [Rathayibacter sp. VKM Ac-2878]
MARRGRQLAIVTAVVLVLLVAAAVVGDSLARRAVADRAAASLREALALPADHAVDVRVGGWAVLPQLLAGRLDSLELRSDDIAFGQLTGDLAATLSGVPASGSGPIDSGIATVALDPASVSTLVAQRSPVPVDGVTLDAPRVRFGTSIEVLGRTLSAGVAVEPAAVDGALQLTPADVTVGGATFTAAQIKDRFGAVADDLLGPRSVCIADSVPRGLTLSGVTVAQQSLDASFALAPTFLSDPEEQQTGTCP